MKNYKKESIIKTQKEPQTNLQLFNSQLSNGFTLLLSCR